MELCTKQKLLINAKRLFSEKGFYGTSINDIAKQVNVSKQALLHHFPTKNKIYAAVLENAMGQLMALIEEGKSFSDKPKEQLKYIMKIMMSDEEDILITTILLLRELLDNRDRADTAQKWYMRPYLDGLVSIIDKGKQQGVFTQAPSLVFVYHLMGSIQYYLVSIPTLKQLYSENEFKLHQQEHEALLFSMLTIFDDNKQTPEGLDEHML